MDLTQRGLEQMRSGQYDDAIITCSRAIQENPDRPEAYLYRGKAYQYRSAMGDPQRAIADFSEAIRLAPESADAYYSRAIVYRDIGRDELAVADDKQARENDASLHHIYHRLPEAPVEKPAVAATTTAVPASSEDAPADSPTVLEIDPDTDPALDLELVVEARKEEQAKAADASGVVLPESAFDQRALYEKLRKQFEPRNRETPRERLDRLTGRSRARPAEPSSPRSYPPPPLVPQPNASPNGGLSAGSGPATSPASPTARAPATPRGAANRPPQPGAGQAPPAFRPVQSPFGQRAPAPTGFGTQPANPFGGQQQQQLPRSVRVPRQTPGGNRYSNPAVRPPNPRDYVP